MVVSVIHFAFSMGVPPAQKFTEPCSDSLFSISVHIGLQTASSHHLYVKGFGGKLA